MYLFKDWTLFEKVWLAVFTAVNLYLFFTWDDTMLGLISSISGMLCVVLVAKGKISNYYFGIIQTAAYAYISYTYQLYGEAMLNGLFYLPIQFIGIYLWRKNQTSESVKGEDVAVKRMNAKAWITFIVLTLAASFIYAILLTKIGGKQVHVDSFAVVLSIGAQILMLKCYAEQWVVWIAVNMLSIVLWGTALKTGGNDYTVLVMWTAFLFNSVYGYMNWLKMAREQKAPGVRAA
ncbi:nicotinamide riboside transporter PnuC [Peribacillus deserti]|uniref:Nicotinamide riboside transporter PnuC n=1 Tax=Peribacillus deserti TaxID=673318 RepID=A0A2N5M3H3_9BACI|nr:nicotinamide riboside transporter PnuC [Peribacillus deserti]